MKITNKDALVRVEAHVARAQSLLGGIEIDGDYGPKTAARVKVLRAAAKKSPDGIWFTDEPDEPEKPTGKLWPRWANESELRAFYTPITIVTITPPYPLRIKLDSGWKPLKTLRCHAKVAGSISRILMEIKSHYNGDLAAIRKAGMDSCGGMYVDRPVTGGKRKSMHAYGAAIDLGVERNQLGTKGDMPKAVIAIFKDEGWRWGGDYTGRKDPMHFEACR